jgi:hypothetical protein
VRSNGMSRAGSPAPGDFFLDWRDAAAIVPAQNLE